MISRCRHEQVRGEWTIITTHGEFIVSLMLSSIGSVGLQELQNTLIPHKSYRIGLSEQSLKSFQEFH